MVQPNRPRRSATRIATALAIAFVLMTGAAPAAAATPFDTNLVRNPGAEAGTGTNGYTTVAIPSWTTDGGSFTVVRYGAPEFPTRAESTRIGGGRHFFSCGPNSAYSAAGQGIAIKGRANLINAGLVKVVVKARIAGYANGADVGRVILMMVDNGSGIKTIATDFVGGTSGIFVRRQVTAVLPPGTDAFYLTLEGDRGDDGGVYCDAYFDKVSVTLRIND